MAFETTERRVTVRWKPALPAGAITRKRVAILAAGLALAVTFSAPGTARADTNHGCGAITDIGVEEPGYVYNGNLTFDGFQTADIFCNVGIPINGEFEIEDMGPTGFSNLGCLSVTWQNAVGAPPPTVTLESPKGCAVNNGKGYTWDDWYAKSIEYHSNQLWMLENAYTSTNDPALGVGPCMNTDVDGLRAGTSVCDANDHYEWFSWPGSNL
jgi:hypothetical protein